MTNCMKMSCPDCGHKQAMPPALAMSCNRCREVFSASDWMVSRVMQDIAQERTRQDKKWGEQNHANGTGRDYKALSVLARMECEVAFKHGKGTWRHILYEEVMEAFAEADPAKLRAELIQVLAVGKAWVECLERQQAQKEKEGNSDAALPE